MSKISRTLLVMEFLEVFHPKRKKSTRATAADKTGAVSGDQKTTRS